MSESTVLSQTTLLNQERSSDNHDFRPLLSPDITSVNDKIHYSATSCRILIHKRRKHSRSPVIASPFQNKVYSSSSSRMSPIPLRSIHLKPPPIHILEKWLAPTIISRVCPAKFINATSTLRTTASANWNPNATPFFPNKQNLKQMRPNTLPRPNITPNNIKLSCPFQKPGGNPYYSSIVTCSRDTHKGAIVPLPAVGLRNIP